MKRVALRLALYALIGYDVIVLGRLFGPLFGPPPRMRIDPNPGHCEDCVDAWERAVLIAFTPDEP